MSLAQPVTLYNTRYQKRQRIIEDDEYRDCPAPKRIKINTKPNINISMSLLSNSSIDPLETLMEAIEIDSKCYNTEIPIINSSSFTFNRKLNVVKKSLLKTSEFKSELAKYCWIIVMKFSL